MFEKLASIIWLCLLHFKRLWKQYLFQDDNKTEPPTTVADIDKADSSLNIEETPEIQKQDETAVAHVTPEYRAGTIVGDL